MTAAAAPPRELDLDFVRSHFPAFAEPTLEGWGFFENAGGSYPCRQTVDALSGFYQRTKVQPFHPFPASAAAGAAMDRARQRWAGALGVGADEVHFGPSTTQNTYVLANAVRRAGFPAGSEVIVTNQDHEANSGPWRRLDEAGFVVREWRIDSETGRLAVADLAGLISERTRLVCMPGCSNVIGAFNDVAAAAELAHAAGAWLVVDAVSEAPHRLPDLSRLGADIWLCSLYKVYGVHQGLMVVRNKVCQTLANEGHFFNAGRAGKRLVPAGPDHAQVAAAGAVVDYLEALDRHHGGDADEPMAVRVARVSALWRAHENRLAAPLLDGLAADPRLRLLGPAETAGGGRAPTVALQPLRRAPDAVARALAEAKLAVGCGHFYAWRPLQALGIDPEVGVVRVSLVHYTGTAEVGRILTALDAAL